MSIVFFLYVFGYLLRSKQRKEKKKRQKKIAKWQRRADNAAGGGGHYRPRSTTNFNLNERTCSVDIDQDGDAPSSSSSSSPSFATIFKSSFKNSFTSSGSSSSRRRISRCQSQSTHDPSAGTDHVDGIADQIQPMTHQLHQSTSTTNSNSNVTTPKSPGGGGLLQWTPSSLSFNMTTVEEGREMAATGMMNHDQSIISYNSSTHQQYQPMRGRAASGGGGSKSPRKLKVSDNEHSHGSFFLRAGAVGNFTFFSLIDGFFFVLFFY